MPSVPSFGAVPSVSARSTPRRPSPQKTGPRACGSGRAAPCRTLTPPDASQPARWLRWAWVPFVAACAGPAPGSASLSLPCPRTALRVPARMCPRLRSRSGAACPAMFGGRQLNIMPGIMRSAKSALSGLRPQCCIMCLCLHLFLIPRPPSVSLRVGLQPLRVFRSPCSRPAPVRPEGAP